MIWTLGLTGGIGSGKSAAAEAFRQHGAAIVDTDVIAHTLTAPGGAAIAALRDTFGSAALTPEGALDRIAMRRRVFDAPAERMKLEAILHPLIRTEADAQLRRLACDRRKSPWDADVCYAVLVVPLLIETGTYRRQIDRLAVVDCPEALQISRVMARSHLTHAAAAAILAAQATRAERLAAADDVIDNSGSLAHLHAQVTALDIAYRALIAG